MQVKGPPIGVTKAFNASYAEGYEGVIDGMIQGNFRSVDNEIDQQDFQSLLKHQGADEWANDFFQRKTNNEADIEVSEQGEPVVLPSTKRSMTGKSFSVINVRKPREASLQWKNHPALQKQWKQRQVQMKLFRDIGKNNKGP